MATTETDLIESINSKLDMQLVETPVEDNCCDKLIATDEEVITGILTDKVPTVKQLKTLQWCTTPFSEEDILRMFES